MADLKYSNGARWGQTWTTFRPIQMDAAIAEAGRLLAEGISPVDVANRICDAHNVAFVEGSGIVLTAKRLAANGGR